MQNTAISKVAIFVLRAVHYWTYTLFRTYEKKKLLTIFHRKTLQQKTSYATYSPSLIISLFF